MCVVWYVVAYFCSPPVRLECQCQFIFLCRLCVCGFRNLEDEEGGGGGGKRRRKKGGGWKGERWKAKERVKEEDGGERKRGEKEKEGRTSENTGRRMKVRRGERGT